MQCNKTYLQIGYHFWNLKKKSNFQIKIATWKKFINTIILNYLYKIKNKLTIKNLPKKSEKKKEEQFSRKKKK